MIRLSNGLIQATDELLEKNIYYLRTKKRMSRVTFSKKMGISLNMLFTLEKGCFPAIFEKPLKNICDYYNLTPEDLYFKDLRSIDEAEKQKRKEARAQKAKKSGADTSPSHSEG